MLVSTKDATYATPPESMTFMTYYCYNDANPPDLILSSEGIPIWGRQARQAKGKRRQRDEKVLNESKPTICFNLVILHTQNLVDLKCIFKFAR